MQFDLRGWRALKPACMLWLCLTASAEATQYFVPDQGAQTVALPGAFAGLYDPNSLPSIPIGNVAPANAPVYRGDPFGIGISAYAFPVVLDTGSSGSVLSHYLAGSDPGALNIPVTGDTYSDEGIGGTETFNVSQPTGLLLASLAIGEEQTETLSNYVSYGASKFQIRQNDPTFLGIPLSVEIIGTPIINQYVMHVKPNNIGYTSLIPSLDYLETELLSSMPSNLPPGAVRQIPLTYKNFIDESNGPAPVSTSTNPMIAGVKVAIGTASNTSDWLFDTGGSITIIGQDMASGLGIDLAHPETTIEVIGIGSLQRTFYGYHVDSLTVPMTGGDELVFQNIMVFVPEEGILPANLPGIFGMNLLGQPTEMVEGFPLVIADSPFTDFYVDAGNSQLVLIESVPEPSTFILLVIAASVFLLRRVVRQSR